MAPISNSAEATYTLVGEDVPETVTSNEVVVNFTAGGSISLTKTASPTTFRAGDIITYTINITNTGSTNFNGVRIIDNLGNNNLAYVIGSGSLTFGSLTYPVTPVATNPLTFTLQELESGQSMTLTYKSQVIFNLSPSVTSITNSVQGIGYTDDGTVTNTTSSTITKKNSSSLEIVKSASATDVNPQMSFSYFITLTNNNTALARVSNITDQLPANFNLVGVKLKIGDGADTAIPAGGYTVSASNLFTIPSATGPTITVPENGQTVLTLYGFFS